MKITTHFFLLPSEELLAALVYSGKSRELTPQFRHGLSVSAPFVRHAPYSKPLGRYHYYRLHPFTLAELEGLTYKAAVFKELPIGIDFHNDTAHSLETFGWFPEPFMKHNNRHLRRWHNEKIERMFREDIISPTTVKGSKYHTYIRW